MRAGAWVGALGVVGLVTMLATRGAPAVASGTTSAYVVMYSDGGDYIGGGTQRLFDTASGSVSVQGTASDLQVSASGGTSGDGFSFEFAAPPGDILTPGGIYTDAQRAPFREAGHPGIDISGDGRGCNTDSGLFEVKDIATDSSGAVTRLWLVYEEHCEGGRAATWGEVSIGENVPSTPRVTPTLVRWPATDVGAPNTVVPVTVKAAGSGVTINSASLTGTNPGDFVVRADECSGKPIAVGASCQVWVKFAATAPGVRTATLRLTDATGVAHDVTLQGFAYGGTTSATMTSDAGDYIGQGLSYAYTPAHGDAISMGGGRTYAGFAIDGANGDWWYADFAAPAGDIIAAGSTYQATRYPFNNGGAGLDVSGNGRGCNTLTGSFTVNSATFAADGTLEGASISFVQHCEGATPAFRGTLAYRAGDTTPPAPWMIPTEPVPAPPPPKSPPSISSFAPTSGQPGTSVTISGANLDGATGVTFNGAGASYAVLSSTEISATVPQNAATGAVAVTTPAGTAVSQASFTVTSPPPPPPPPTVTSVAPTSGTPGTTVTLTGSSFAGATAVSFNGTSAVFNVISTTRIQTSVPAGATSGPISVTTPSGTASSSSSFAVTGAAPSIASFSPASGSPGTTVTISGSGFTGTSAVLFNGVPAVYNVVSASQIQASVPSNASTGRITVTTASGSTQSATDFTVGGSPSVPAPVVASLTPSSGTVGAAVTIAGSNFSGASAVAFNGTAATFAVVSPTEIDTSVPTGASSGPVSVTTPAGTALSASAFTVVASAPPPPPPPPSGGGGGGGTSVPNLAVTITPSASAVAAGGEVNVAVSVANTGGAGTLWSHTVISLPSGAALLGTPGFSTGSGCTGTQTIDCNTDYIANGTVSRITFGITLANPGAATISVTATADRDADPSNNTAQATIDVAAPQAPFTPPTPSPAPKPTVAPWWASCPQLNKRYPHGVGRVGAHDKTRGKPVTTFKRNTSLYRLAVRHNRKLDGDRDGIACEKH